MDRSIGFSRGVVRGARFPAPLVVALALVVTASGSVALGQDERALPILGTEIPTGADSGVIDTPLGPARWVHLSGDAATLPAEAPFAQGSLFVVLEQATNDSGDQLGRRRWTSADGLHWTSRPLSVPPITAVAFATGSSDTVVAGSLRSGLLGQG